MWNNGFCVLLKLFVIKRVQNTPLKFLKELILNLRTLTFTLLRLFLTTDRLQYTFLSYQLLTPLDNIHTHNNAQVADGALRGAVLHLMSNKGRRSCIRLHPV